MSILSELLQAEEVVAGAHLVVLLMSRVPRISRTEVFQHRVAPASVLPASLPKVECDSSNMSNDRRFAAQHQTENTKLHACVDNQSHPPRKYKNTNQCSVLSVLGSSNAKAPHWYALIMIQSITLHYELYTLCILLTHFRDLR